ncbi:MAG: 2Fe-2S iron-sulfur cluster binding domain-containing protein [Pseudohongiella sp.]|nr:2Fe-2S iron-sulfur cluster binding domain-containing protein [Pseudohongiella sp.]
MPEVTFEGNTYVCSEEETVLECLHRHDVSIASSCLNGICQSCIMQSGDGHLPEKAQSGLKDSWRSLGYFLACQCRPTDSLQVARVDSAETKFRATLTRIEPLSSTVIGVWMRPELRFDYRPGQFVNFVREGNLIRSYSIASVPALQDELEFHVALMPEGKMSGWLHDNARAGDSLDLQGPLGSCFYVPGKSEQALLLVGTGTGLAPLYGIVRDALEAGHTGPIHLLHGALEVRGLYLVDVLRQLALEHDNFTYTPCALRTAEEQAIEYGDISELTFNHHPQLKGWRAYLCGHPDTIKPLQKKCFLAGVSMSDILVDVFLPAQ